MVTFSLPPGIVSCAGACNEASCNTFAMSIRRIYQNWNTENARRESDLRIKMLTEIGGGSEWHW